MTNRGAIAVFVKTPGISPVKTRLAAAVGAEQAEAFYRACLLTVEAVVTQSEKTLGLSAYWAVAEPEGVVDPLWSSFDVTLQGPGGLGERLDRVYCSLLNRHPSVILVGADAPLLSVGLIRDATEAMRSDRTPFAISRSTDGGYALFAGRFPLPQAVWTTVPYSCDRTAAEFLARLRPHGEVAELPSLDDVDTFDDLARLAAEASKRPLSPEQAAVASLAQELLAGSGHG